MKKIVVTHREGTGAILTIDGEVVHRVMSIELRWDNKRRRFEFAYSIDNAKPGQSTTVQEVTFRIPVFTLDVR